MCELECKNRTPPHCSEKHQLVPVALCLHWNDMHFTFKNTHCSDLVLLLPLGAKIMKPLHINSNFCVCASNAKHFTTEWIWPEASCRALALSLCLFVSLLLSDKASAIHYWTREQPPVFWLCVCTVQYTELVFTVCHWQNAIQWRTSPLCVITVAFMLPSALSTIRL